MDANTALTLFETPGALSYCDNPQVKADAHKEVKAILSDFARIDLGLNSKQFDIRSNMGGIAVSGEVTLHTDPFPGCDKGIYIQVSDSSVRPILVRACDHRKDYRGHQNNWRGAEMLSTPQNRSLFADDIRRMVAS